MSITQRRSLDSNAIKLIAILAMTVDHIAGLRLSARGSAADAPHRRITCPIM